MGNWQEYVLLENPEYFDFGNGLWTGKKPPFQSVTVIRNTNFTNSGKIDYSDVAVLNVEKKQFEQRRLLQGDIIIERSGGGPKQPVGRVVYFDRYEGDYSFSNFTSRIRVINRALDNRYVFYFLVYFYDSGKTYEMQAQTTGIRNLDFTKYKNSVQIPLIPLSEQRKIAYVLNTIQKAIEQQGKLIHTTTELKKALMQKLFTEGTKGEKQKKTEIGLVPESWEVMEIGKKTEKTRLNDPTKNPDADFIYVDVSSVDNELMRVTNPTHILGKDAPSRARKLIQTNDVIFATVRPTLRRIARISGDLNNQVCSTGYCVLKPIKDQLNSEYLFQYLQTTDFITRIEKLQRGASYPAVRDSDVKGMKIPFPEYKEQVIIGDILKSLDHKRTITNTQKQTLTNLFKTLLHELMTGYRRVNEIDFEVLNMQYQMNEQPLSMAAEQ